METVFLSAVSKLLRSLVDVVCVLDSSIDTSGFDSNDPEILLAVAARMEEHVERFLSHTTDGCENNSEQWFDEQQESISPPQNKRKHSDDDESTEFCDIVPLIQFNEQFWFCKKHIELFFGIKNLTSIFKSKKGISDLFEGGDDDDEGNNNTIVIEKETLKTLNNELLDCADLNSQYHIRKKTASLILISCEYLLFHIGEERFINKYRKKNLSWPTTLEDIQDVEQYNNYIKLL